MTARQLLLAAALVGSLPAPPLPAGQAESDRPTVALVLAGGGAKGLAHVGVLRWLEEHRVPVDYVAGTSMGGLIGGAYASGMSAAEVHDLLAGLDWEELFAGDVPFRLKGFRRKQDRRSYPARLELGLRGGVRLASALDSGHMVGLLLSRIAFPYSPLRDFDALPIPFRCVATDILAGEQVVLDRGSLALALRATMAIPGVFPPVRHEGRELVDGGVLNNLPVDVARRMGAEVVIAVNLPVPPPEEGLSLFGIVGRSLDLMIGETASRHLALADVAVEPDVEGFDSTDWRELETLTQRGYDAAAAREEALGRLSLDESRWRAHLEERRARRRQAPERATFVRIAQPAPAVAEEITARLSEDHVGASFDPHRFEDDLSTVVGSGAFESALYEAVRDDERPGLLVRLTEKAHAPPFVNFSTDVRSRGDELVFNVGARMTSLGLVGPGSEWRLDGAAGSTIGLASELLLPLGESGLALAPRAFTSRTTADVFDENRQIATFRSGRSGGGVDLRASLGRSGELRLGWAGAHLDFEPRIGDPGLPAQNGAETRYELRWILDTQDSPTIPSRGVRVVATGRYYDRIPDSAEDDFPIAAASLVAAWPTGGRDRALLNLRGGTSFRTEPPASNQFTLGGPFLLGAFDEDEFRGRHFAFASVAWLKSIGRLPEFVGGGAFLYLGAEAGTAFDRFQARDIQADGVLGLAVDTAFGPVFAGAAIGSSFRARLFFSVGASFPFRPPLDREGPLR